MKNIIRFLVKNKYKIIIVLIFIIGIFVRIIGIDKIPYGFNQDEASAGYEAYSIIKSGMDRNRKEFSHPFYIMGKWTKCTIFIYYDNLY